MKILLHLSTLGPIGYLKGGGTWASMLTFCIAVWLRIHLSFFYFAILTLLVTYISFLIIEWVVPLFDYYDPPSVVIDEVAGSFWALFIYPVPLAIGLSLFFYRLFDITKWCGIWLIDQQKNSRAVLLDDVMAGILASAVVFSFSWIISCWHW